VHSYPLHQPVTAICHCCKRRDRFVFKSPSDHVLCPLCMKHQGTASTTVRRAHTEHADLWQRDIARLTTEHDQTVANLRAERDALKQELEDRPVREVEVSLDKDTLREAETAKERAYRLRDWSMSKLSFVAHYHRDAENGSCMCGKPKKQCRDLKRLEDWRPEIDAWEKRQLQRVRRGLSSALGHDHPLMLDRRNWVALDDEPYDD
jgi:hypothetical protein